MVKRALIVRWVVGSIPHEGRKEQTTHSTHFSYGYMASEGSSSGDGDGGGGTSSSSNNSNSSRIVVEV